MGRELSRELSKFTCSHFKKMTDRRHLQGSETNLLKPSRAATPTNCFFVSTFSPSKVSSSSIGNMIFLEANFLYIAKQIEKNLGKIMFCSVKCVFPIKKC